MLNYLCMSFRSTPPKLVEEQCSTSVWHRLLMKGHKKALLDVQHLAVAQYIYIVIIIIIIPYSIHICSFFSQPLSATLMSSSCSSFRNLNASSTSLCNVHKKKATKTTVHLLKHTQCMCVCSLPQLSDPNMSPLSIWQTGGGLAHSASKDRVAVFHMWS